MHATCDKATPVSLAQHTYFNLHGHDKGKDVTNHKVRISAMSYTPADSALIPTGEIKSVLQTPFDLFGRE